MPSARQSEDLYIGLMSGTSMDGIDAALVAFGDRHCDVRTTMSVPYPDALRDELLKYSRQPAELTVDRIGNLDQWVGACFRDAALALLERKGVDAETVTAIGSHGQTIRHQPRAARPFTLQVGDPNVVAAGTGITTVADFRRRDVALGGEGAPLAPAFHRWLFADDKSNRAVLNIGGIANVTMLPVANEPVIGFDTGPGNTLLDAWSRLERHEPYDANGDWARSGKVIDALFQKMLGDPYFELAPPKSTGFEYFNAVWVRQQVSSFDGEKFAGADVQATLAELTAFTISTAILKFAPDIASVLVCGGGVHNADLIDRLRAYLSGTEVVSTQEFGLHPDWVEAAAFAWLAKRCIEGKPGNLPEVTGARAAAVLGAVYPGSGSRDQASSPANSNP